MKKRIIGTIAVTAAGLVSVTGLWPQAPGHAVNRAAGLLAGQRGCLAAGPCAGKPAAAMAPAAAGR